MADTRKWIKISLDLPMHPKMLAVSVPARWLFMEMLCYCSEYMTDGVVPEVVAKRLGYQYGKRHAKHFAKHDAKQKGKHDAKRVA